MSHGYAVVKSFKANGMDTWYLAAAHRLDISLDVHIFVHDVRQTSCSTARSIQFMTMMHLHHIRAVTSCLSEQFRHIVRDCKEYVYAYGIVAGPYHRGAAFLEICNHLILDIRPPGGSDHDCAEILSKELIVRPERSRCGEVYTYAFFCQRRFGLSDSLAPACIFKTAFKDDLLDHPSHFSVSAYK